MLKLDDEDRINLKR